MKKKGKNNSKGCDKMMILMIICVLLSLTTLAIVTYDKFIKVEPEPSWAKCWNGD